MKERVRSFRLIEEERLFLQGVMDQAIAKAQKKDIGLCVKYAMTGFDKDAKVLARAKSVLRPVVMQSFQKRDGSIFR